MKNCGKLKGYSSIDTHAAHEILIFDVDEPLSIPYPLNQAILENIRELSNKNA